MADPVYFTVAADFRAFIEDASSDSDYDPQIVPVGGTVTFTPLVNAGDVVLATQTSPRPIGFIPSPVTAIIDPADGRLKLRRTADSGASGSLGFAPVRLLGTSPVLELDGPLFYSVTFSEVTYASGRRGSITGFTFEAPNTDTELNLITVFRQPGVAPSGITKIAPGGVRRVDNQLIFSFGGIDLDDPIDLSYLSAGSYTQYVGDGSATSFIVNHGLGQRGVSVSVYDTTTWAEVEVDVAATSTNAVTVTFATAPALNGYLCAVISGGGPQGPVGATGATGATGASGASGIPGPQWWFGEGPPGTIIGSSPNDIYIDTLTGTLYRLGG